MQALTMSMTRAANSTLDWVRGLGKPPQKTNYECIRRTLEAYRLQPVSVPAEAEPQEELEDVR